MRLRATRSTAVAQPARASLPLDVDAAAYITAVQAAGGSLTGTQKTALSGFVASAKTGGYWAKLLDVGTFSGGTLASAAVKLKSEPVA